MPRDEELPIIRAFYDFVLWLNPKIANIPETSVSCLGSAWKGSFTTFWKT